MVTVLNLTEGQVFHHQLIYVAGSLDTVPIKESHEYHEMCHNEHCTTNEVHVNHVPWPVVNGRFKVFILLHKGENKVRFSCLCGYASVILTLRYHPEEVREGDRLVKFVYIKCSDSSGCYQDLPSEQCSEELGVSKVRFNALLAQCYYYESLKCRREKGLDDCQSATQSCLDWGGGTFKLGGVEVFESCLTEEMSLGDDFLECKDKIYSYFHNELIERGVITETTKVVAVLSCTRYIFTDDNCCNNDDKNDKHNVKNDDNEVTEAAERRNQVKSDENYNTNGDVIRPYDDLIRPDDDVIRPHDDVIRPHDDVIRPHDDVIRPHDDVIRPHDDVIRPHDHIRCHTALGGGQLALIGGGGLYSWGSSPQDLLRAMWDSRRVPRRRLFDDSGGEGTYGGVYSTTFGAMVHELGHAFNLAHTRCGIMGRGFDDMRAFVCLEKHVPSVKLPGNILTHVKKEGPVQGALEWWEEWGGACWSAPSALLLKAHPWFTPDLDEVCRGSGTSFDCPSISSPSGLSGPYGEASQGCKELDIQLTDCTIRVYYGEFVNGFIVNNHNGGNNNDGDNDDGRVGRIEGEMYEITLGTDQRVSEVCIRSGQWIDAIQFKVTAKRAPHKMDYKTPNLGGSGGTPAKISCNNRMNTMHVKADDMFIRQLYFSLSDLPGEKSASNNDPPGKTSTTITSPNGFRHIEVWNKAEDHVQYYISPSGCIEVKSEGVCEGVCEVEGNVLRVFKGGTDEHSVRIIDGDGKFFEYVI